MAWTNLPKDKEKQRKIVEGLTLLIDADLENAEHNREYLESMDRAFGTLELIRKLPYFPIGERSRLRSRYSRTQQKAMSHASRG